MSKFMKRIEKARAAAKTAPSEAATGPKDPATMTAEERAAEIARIEWEKEKAEARAIAFGREALGEAQPTRSSSPRRLPFPTNRPPYL